MQSATHHSAQAEQGAPTAPRFSAIAQETRAAVDTETAAYWLMRRPQTLRCWAAYETGPIRPVRIHGRLAWSVADLRRLLGVTA